MDNKGLQSIEADSPTSFDVTSASERIVHLKLTLSLTELTKSRKRTQIMYTLRQNC